MEQLLKYMMINRWYIAPEVNTAMRRINGLMFIASCEKGDDCRLSIYEWAGRQPKDCLLDLSLGDVDKFYELVKNHFDKELTIEHTRNND